MEFIVKSPLKDNIHNLMRGIGYHSWGKDGGIGELNLVHPLGGDAYPRFHLYIKTKNQDLIFNLHLDQKKPSYEGTSAHSGEYEGEVVEKEAERIKESIK